MNFLKTNIKIAIYFFCIGFLVSSLPFTLDIIEIRKVKRLKLLEKNFLKKEQEKICKEKSKYDKFYQMGFQEIAKNRLISCLEESNLIK